MFGQLEKTSRAPPVEIGSGPYGGLRHRHSTDPAAGLLGSGWKSAVDPTGDCDIRLPPRRSGNVEIGSGPYGGLRQIGFTTKR